MPTRHPIGYMTILYRGSLKVTGRMTKDEFQNTINEFIIKNPKGVLFLAKECEVASSTVIRWANGISSPHPLIMKWVVSLIE